MFAFIVIFFTVVCAECPDKCQCSRYKMFCSLARLNSLPTELLNTTQLVKIELDNITQINTTTGLQNVTHLQLVSVNLRRIQNGAFQNMSELEHLEITYNSIEVLKRNSFIHLEKLYFLNLSKNGITSLEAGAFHGLRNIRILDLSENSVWKCSAKAFEGMGYYMINTEEYQSLFRYSAIEYAAVRYVSTLTHFKFSHAKIRDSELKYIPSYVTFGFSITGDYVEYVNRNNIRPTNFSELTYFAATEISLDDLKKIKLKNFTKLTHLDLSDNYIEEISSGDFEGLVCLKILEIHHNDMQYLHNATFRGLESLETLDMSVCRINRIERDAFEGLSKLRVLNLRYNRLDSLINVKFSTLRMLKELKLEANTIYRIDYEAFSHMSHLKSLVIPYALTGSKLYYFYENERLQLSSTVNQTTFPNLQRLDNLDIFGQTTISQYTQVLKSLNVYIDARSVNPQQVLRYVLQTVRYVRNFSVTLLHENSTQHFAILHEFHTFIPNIINNELELLKNKSFIGSSLMKCLTSADRHNTTTQEGATDFREEIENFRQYFHFNVTYTQNSSLELENFKSLSIHIRKSKVGCLGRSFFQGSGGLTRLNLQRNGFTCLRPGAFQGLDKIEEIDLMFNEIERIEAGVFGALCEDEISYGNATMSEYCSYTSALTTLKYLNLAHNNISHINPHAFISCTNLQILDLSQNMFMTLDTSFLYTPGLRKLYMSAGSVINIPRNTVDCIPSLSETHLYGKKIHKLRNDFRCQKGGAFEMLRNIQEIRMSFNKIQRIEAGVFGALCKDKFNISCKNVSLPEYCNNTNALKTLKYLYLDNNNISHIDALAFISCTNLHTLHLSNNRFLTLDNAFLYTPGLRKLDMSLCSVYNIPNDTFYCTPQLLEIYLQRNQRITNLTVSVLLPLKHLQHIDLSGNHKILCDCNLYDSWIWMRRHHVHYKIFCNSTKNGLLSSNEGVEMVLSNMACNNETTDMYVPQNHNTSINDFAIFKGYIEPIVLIIILIFGLACNGFLLFVSFRHSDMRRKQNACIIHLAVADVLFLLLNLPLSYWDTINIRWEFNDTLCKIFIFSKDVIVAVSALSVVALSVERYLVARNFNNLNEICKSEKPPTAWLLLMTWISAIITSLPAYLSAVVEERCLYCPPGNQDYIRNVWTFQLIMYCLLPAAVVTFLNVKTSIFLRESIRRIPGEIRDNIRAKNRKTVANTVLILVPVFFVSYVPNYILRVLVAWSVVDVKDALLVPFFTFWLFFLNAVFNPISIFIMSSKFKCYALSYFPFLENIKNSRTVPVFEKRNLYRHKGTRLEK